ncbi:MAG: hypothetical protein QM286_12895 [Acidobacteriota bacterium]|jgi:hypothetical protein|nr:hypothetical protein [Acidobacteriota bacterium]
MAPAVTNSTGEPLMRVEALLARLSRATDQADVNMVCEVLAILTGADSDVEPFLPQWERTLVVKAVPMQVSILAAAEQEAAHSEGLGASQAGGTVGLNDGADPLTDLPILIEELLVRASDYSAGGQHDQAEDLMAVVEMLSIAPDQTPSEVSDS